MWIKSEQSNVLKTTSKLEANKNTEIYFIMDKFSKEFDKTIKAFRVQLRGRKK